jgi:hypothetical protein
MDWRDLAANFSARVGGGMNIRVGPPGLQRAYLSADKVVTSKRSWIVPESSAGNSERHHSCDRIGGGCRPMNMCGRWPVQTKPAKVIR